MKIESPSFKNGEFIPKKFTSHGEDVSPKLFFQDVPKQTKSLALIMDDPDAPMGTFVHWLAWNIPADTKELSEGVDLPEQGLNSYEVPYYRGPNPPEGPVHRYFFKLYALDTFLELSGNTTKERLEKALEGHVIEKAETIGLFQHGE